MSRRKILAIGAFLISVGASGVLFSGCGDEQQQAPHAAQVKIMKAIKQDTQLKLEYAGTIKGRDEVKVQAKVSGNIVEKYVHGGDIVTAGQPLFRIDSRQYQAQLLNAQSNLAQAQASYNNSAVDLQRYEQLYESGAISEQALATMRSTTDSLRANVEALTALVALAQSNLDDCLVTAPMSGKLGVDDVAVGTFVTPGATSLVSIGNQDQMYVQFSLSETEYLNYNKNSSAATDDLPGTEVLLTLANGKEFPITGHVVSVDRAMGENSSSMAVKALFDNPDGVLVSGMFARVRLQGDIAKDAVLVPQRAVQQLLGKSFVMIVGEDGKSKAVSVEIGPRVGSYYIINSGLNGSEEVVVEGLTTLTEGVDLATTEVTGQEMGLAFTDEAGNAVL